MIVPLKAAACCITAAFLLQACTDNSGSSGVNPAAAPAAAPAPAAVPAPAPAEAVPTATTAAPEPAAPTATAPSGVARATLAQGLYELAYSEKQNVLFVASAGSFKDPEVPQQVLVVDPQELTILAAIPLTRRAFSLALDDAGNRLYVGNTGQGAVTVIDTASRQVLDTFQLVPMVPGREGRQRPAVHFRQLLLDAPNGNLYLLGFDDHDSSLFVMDTATGKVKATLPGFGYTATGIALDARNHRLYASNMAGEAVVVDTRSHEVVDRFDLGVEQPLNLAYDAGQHRLLAVDQGHPKMREFQKRGMPGYESRHPGHRVVAIDLDTLKTVAEMPAGGPINLAIDAPRHRLYITNRASGEVTVFDSRDYSPLETVKLPDHPNSLSIDGRDGTVYVSVKAGEEAPAGTGDGVARVRF